MWSSERTILFHRLHRRDNLIQRDDACTPNNVYMSIIRHNQSMIIDALIAVVTTGPQIVKL